MKKLALCLLSLATIMAGCTSQEFDEPDNYASAAEDTGWYGMYDRVHKTDVSKEAALSDMQQMREFYKDENGFWHPIDEDAKITAQQMNEKIIGHGWEKKPYSYRKILEDGTTEAPDYYLLGQLSGCAGYDDFKLSFHPGYVRRYGKRYWDHDFYYHDDNRLDTDAPIIGYTSTDDRDWLMPITLINDNTLIVITTDYTYKGNGVYALTGTGGYYVFTRVSDDEFATWPEKYSVNYWGN